MEDTDGRSTIHDVESDLAKSPQPPAADQPVTSGYGIELLASALPPPLPPSGGPISSSSGIGDLPPAADQPVASGYGIGLLASALPPPLLPPPPGGPISSWPDSSGIGDLAGAYDREASGEQWSTSGVDAKPRPISTPLPLPQPLPQSAEEGAGTQGGTSTSMSTAVAGHFQPPPEEVQRGGRGNGERTLLRASVGSLRYRAYWIGMFSLFLASIVVWCNSIGAGAPGGVNCVYFVFIAIASLVVWFPILGCCMTSCNELPWSFFPNWLEMLVGPGNPPVTFTVVGGDATELSVVVGGLLFPKKRFPLGGVVGFDVYEESAAYEWSYHDNKRDHGGGGHYSRRLGRPSRSIIEPNAEIIASLSSCKSALNPAFECAHIPSSCCVPGGSESKLYTKQGYRTGHRRWLRLGMTLRVEDPDEAFVKLSRKVYQARDAAALFDLLAKLRGFLDERHLQPLAQ